MGIVLVKDMRGNSIYLDEINEDNLLDSLE